MLKRIGIAVVLAVGVGLGCMLLGAIFTALKVDIAVQVGEFLKEWGFVIGVLVGLYHFFTGKDTITV